MADTTEIRTRDLRARTPTRLPLRFLTPPTGVQADQAEKKTSPRNDGPTEIRTRDPRVRSPTLYRYATPPTLSCRSFGFLSLFAVRRTVWPPYWIMCDFLDIFLIFRGPISGSSVYFEGNFG